MEASASPRDVELQQSFRQGVWNQHMRDVKTEGAKVRGMRFFFQPGPSGGDPGIPGGAGYLTIVPDMIKTVDTDSKTIELSLEKKKGVLEMSKAWQPNLAGWLYCDNKHLPVLAVKNGRPLNQCFAAEDGLLGVFHVQASAQDSLGCRLVCEEDKETFEKALERLSAL